MKYIMLYFTYALALLSIHLIIPPNAVAGRYENGEFYWINAKGDTCTLAELDTILVRHQQWLEMKPENLEKLTHREQGQYYHNQLKADLSYSNLSGIDLCGKNLSYAELGNINLSDSRLRTANLSFTILANANLSHSDLTASKMQYANLFSADLSSTTLVNTNISNAYLFKANLCRASIVDANLSSANLMYSNLSGTFLSKVDLKDVLFEPASLPTVSNMVSMRNLSRIRYRYNNIPMVQLKNSFNNAELLKQAKQVNTALHRVEATWWETLLFDYTCEWGSNAGRPLVILLLLWLIFSGLYGLLDIYQGNRREYMIANPKAIKKENEMQPDKWTRVKNGLAAYGIAWVFGLQRSLRIGFREISPNHWLSLLLPRDFKIYSEGWPRYVSGFQSLLSVYLIALSILSYFGRPFEF